MVPQVIYEWDYTRGLRQTNGLTGSIHQRANVLKINIQLKLLQSGLKVPEIPMSTREYEPEALT